MPRATPPPSLLTTHARTTVVPPHDLLPPTPLYHPPHARHGAAHTNPLRIPAPISAFATHPHALCGVPQCPATFSVSPHPFCVPATPSASRHPICVPVPPSALTPHPHTLCGLHQRPATLSSSPVTIRPPSSSPWSWTALPGDPQQVPKASRTACCCAVHELETVSSAIRLRGIWRSLLGCLLGYLLRGLLGYLLHSLLCDLLHSLLCDLLRGSLEKWIEKSAFHFPLFLIKKRDANQAF
ncbi:hypothetical protein K439DRAFT_1622927 [Ramaria rubella]|nr:hypothetical protein K439DRAFT_1622927 [Ramaria rubella]